MKKMSKYIFTIFLIILSVVKVNALSLSESNLTIANGSSKNVVLYANSETLINKVEFTMVYTTYDIPANFIVNSNYTDSNPNGIKHTINFNEELSGKIELGSIDIRVVNNPKESAGTINIHSAKGYTKNGEIVNLNIQNINVLVGKETPVNNQNDTNKEEKEIEKNLLKEIESKLVNIELKEDVYEYRISIKEDIKELDLKPILKDEKYKVDISTQKISEIKDNKITIKVSNGDYQEEYIININIKENITIDNSEFKKDNSYKSKWIVMIVIFSVILLVSLIFTNKK